MPVIATVNRRQCDTQSVKHGLQHHWKLVPLNLPISLPLTGYTLGTLHSGFIYIVKQYTESLTFIIYLS